MARSVSTTGDGETGRRGDAETWAGRRRHIRSAPFSLWLPIREEAVAAAECSVSPSPRLSPLRLPQKGTFPRRDADAAAAANATSAADIHLPPSQPRSAAMHAPDPTRKEGGMCRGHTPAASLVSGSRRGLTGDHHCDFGTCATATMMTGAVTVAGFPRCQIERSEAGCARRVLAVPA